MAGRVCRWLGLFCLISLSVGRSIAREDRWKFFEDVFGVDPNDRVDVQRWNRMNDDDLKRMPMTDDYSDEEAAIDWLQWNSRISERFRQVRRTSIEFSREQFVFRSAPICNGIIIRI